MSRIATSAGWVGQQLDQRVAVGRAADHLVARRLQQHQQALAEEGTVLGQRYSHGILAVIVPMPGPPGRRRSFHPAADLVEHRLGVPHVDPGQRRRVEHVAARGGAPPRPAGRPGPARRGSRRRRSRRRPRRPGRTAPSGASTRTAASTPSADLAQRRAEPGLVEQRRVDLARRRRAAPAATACSSSCRPVDGRVQVGLVDRDPVPEQPELQGERGDPQRGAVVQLPLQAPPAQPLARARPGGRRPAEGRPSSREERRRASGLPCSGAVRGASPARCAGSSIIAGIFRRPPAPGNGGSTPPPGGAFPRAVDRTRVTLRSGRRLSHHDAGLFGCCESSRDLARCARLRGASVGYNLGVDLGTTFVAAAIAHDTRVEMFTLGDRTVVTPAVIFLGDDGTLVSGDAAGRRAVSSPDRVGREFKRRLGDPTPVLLGGTSYAVTTLLGTLLHDVVDAGHRDRGREAGQRGADPPGELGAVPPGAVRGGAAGRRADRDPDGHRAGGGGGALRRVPAARRRRDHRRVRPGRRHLRRHRAAQDPRRHRDPGRAGGHRAARRRRLRRGDPVLRQLLHRRRAVRAGHERPADGHRAGPAAPGLRAGQGGAVHRHRDRRSRCSCPTGTSTCG